MPTPFRNAAGVDLEELFDPDVMGDGPVAPALRLHAGHPGIRFAAIAYGSKGPNVGYRSASGMDVSNIWAARGTARYSIPGLDGKSLSAIDAALTAQQSVSANVGVSIFSNGTWTATAGTSQGAAPVPAPASGTWLPAGKTGADFDVRFRVSDSGDSTRQVSNTAASFTRLSSGGFGASLSLQAVNLQGSRSAQATIFVDLRDRATGNVTTSRVEGAVTVSGFI